MKPLHFDILIIGAGLSGIGTACHLSRECPNGRFAILERRSRIGGTWDLFRYPGIRSDSDMFSFSFSFRPWKDLELLASGASIQRYINDTAEEYGIFERIHFGIDLHRANWCSTQKCWQLEGISTTTAEPCHYTCHFLISCTGYYDHQQGFQPQLPGAERFRGDYIHPQQWPAKLDYHNQTIIVVGSGATVITLVPALAKAAKHVTMLQRSPGYILSIPSSDRLSSVLLKFLPKPWVFAMARWRNIKIQRWLFKASRRWPVLMQNLFLRAVRKSLPPGFDMQDFTPTYNPWTQRVCAIPDKDLFKAMTSARVSVETGQIETVNEDGILLKSGKQLNADIIITATGLKLQVLGGIALCIDDEPVPIRQKLTYKAVLMEGVPNMSWIFGYTNASWTLKADIAARYICRLLNHMAAKGYRVCVAHDKEGCAENSSIMAGLDSGYVKRAEGILPRQGSKPPWRLLNDYEKDSKILLNAAIEDGIITFEAQPISRGAPQAHSVIQAIK